MSGDAGSFASRKHRLAFDIWLVARRPASC